MREYLNSQTTFEQPEMMLRDAPLDIRGGLREHIWPFNNLCGLTDIFSAFQWGNAQNIRTENPLGYDRCPG